MSWLSRLLFFVLAGTAMALVATIVIAPWIGVTEAAGLGNRVWNLFAGDAVVRRTGLVTALGLLVTACVFFRPRHLLRAVLRRTRPNRLPPPGNIAGA